MSEAENRVKLLFKIMFYCARSGRRVREQILAFGIAKDTDRDCQVCADNDIDQVTYIPDEG